MRQTRTHRRGQFGQETPTRVRNRQPREGAHTLASGRAVIEVVADLEDRPDLAEPCPRDHLVSVAQGSVVAAPDLRDVHSQVERANVGYVETHRVEQRAARRLEVFEVATVPHDTQGVAVVERDTQGDATGVRWAIQEDSGNTAVGSVEVDCGEGGIRTRGRFPYARLASEYHRPLGHLSGWRTRKVACSFLPSRDLVDPASIGGVFGGPESGPGADAGGARLAADAPNRATVVTEVARTLLLCRTLSVSMCMRDECLTAAGIHRRVVFGSVEIIYPKLFHSAPKARYPSTYSLNESLDVQN